MHSHVALTIDWMAVFHRWKEAPFVERFEQDLIEARIRRRLHQLDFRGAVRVNGEARYRFGAVSVLAQIVRQQRQRLGKQPRLRGANR